MEQARTPKVSDKNLQLSNSNSNVRQNSLSWTFGTFTPPSPSLSLLLALDCLAPAQTQFIVTHTLTSSTFYFLLIYSILFCCCLHSIYYSAESHCCILLHTWPRYYLGLLEFVRLKAMDISTLLNLINQPAIGFYSFSVLHIQNIQIFL